MKPSYFVTLMAMVPLILCSACSDQPTKTSSLTQASNQPQQLSDIRWDEVTAATSAAQVNNTSLIMMR